LRYVGNGGLGVARLIHAVVAMIVIQVVYHILLALDSGAEPKDERDSFIECKAYRNGYFSLATGAFLIIGCVLAAEPAQDAAPNRIIVTPFLIVNLVLLFMVLAELVKLTTQLFY
jgi:Ni,Fe-hydrogenase I cytochrome b subunit